MNTCKINAGNIKEMFPSVRKRTQPRSRGRLFWREEKRGTWVRGRSEGYMWKNTWASYLREGWSVGYARKNTGRARAESPPLSYQETFLTNNQQALFN